jgi:hypothetical protein
VSPLSGARLTLLAASAAIVCSSAATDAQSQEEAASHRAKQSAARWQRIEYSRVPIPGAPDRSITAYLTGGTRVVPSQREQLRFALSFIEPAGQKRPESLAQPHEFSVRMHFADGRTVDAETPHGEEWDGAGNQVAMTSSRSYVFRWAANAYDEAWIEWRLPDRSFWFEVPYGFVRDPAEAWPPPDEERSEPRLALALQPVAPEDRLVPWKFVEYRVGELPNRLSLTVRFANPFRPAADVILNHNFEGTWTADAPKTAIRVQESPETTRVAFRSEGSLIRVDTFRLAYGGSDDGRGSGVVTISVDNQTLEITVPSSLFKHLHGTADYENKQRLPRDDDFMERLIRLSE